MQDYGTCEFQDRGKSGVDNFVPWSLDDPARGSKLRSTTPPEMESMIKFLKLNCMRNESMYS